MRSRRAQTIATLIFARESTARHCARASVPARSVHFSESMSLSAEPIRILLVRAWTEPLGPLREALREARVVARIARVDIEPALNAALERGSKFDVVVFDPATRGISREILDARLRDHRRSIPVVTLKRIEDLASAIRVALAALRN
jgi:hypothetical protein